MLIVKFDANRIFRRAKICAKIATKVRISNFERLDSAPIALICIANRLSSRITPIAQQLTRLIVVVSVWLPKFIGANLRATTTTTWLAKFILSATLIEYDNNKESKIRYANSIATQVD